jgi:DNA invertase Pin-like site-specific DNA recombinase
MSKKVIELIRVSTEGQAAADRASIPAQRAANRRTAEFYGLEIHKSIEISDVSGAAVLHAPEIREMIELMRSPEIHGVVAKEFSRLMRPENFDDYALLQHFADTKTILYLPEGPIDLGSKMGRLMGGVRALFAGVEREAALTRVKTEIANLAAKRERILSAFFDGVIAGSERDSHLAGIETELKVNQGLVAQHTPVEHATTEVLDSICWTFHDWEFLNVADKRRILSSTGADIRVANSSIHGLYINLPESRHNEISRGDKGSSPLPA